MKHMVWVGGGPSRVCDMNSGGAQRGVGQEVQREERGRKCRQRRGTGSAQRGVAQEVQREEQPWWCLLGRLVSPGDVSGVHRILLVVVLVIDLAHHLLHGGKG